MRWRSKSRPPMNDFLLMRSFIFASTGVAVIADPTDPVQMPFFIYVCAFEPLTKQCFWIQVLLQLQRRLCTGGHPSACAAPARRLLGLSISCTSITSEIASSSTSPSFQSTSPSVLQFHGFTNTMETGEGSDRPTGAQQPQSQELVSHTSASAFMGAASSELPTLPTVLRRAVTKSLGACTPSFLKQGGNDNRAANHYILHDVSGVFKPSTMTLVLGQPGSGKSSLLQLLSGRFPLESEGIAVKGDVMYNDESRESLTRRLPQFAAYVPQQDLHLSTLTVRETHEFAHTCSTAHFDKHVEGLLGRAARVEDNGEAQTTARSLLRHLPQITLELLGLQHCADTIIGGNLQRGVSGGERKRVTTGEMLVGFKLALFLDSITTGLDSAAAYDIVSTLRGRARSFGQTVVAALLQPAPEVFELFDDVLLLIGGRVAYHGPVNEVRGYFESLGFYCPPGRDFADFLMDLGTDDQLRYQTATTASPESPRTTKQFAAVFSGSSIYQRNLQQLETPVDANVVETTHKFMDTIPEFQQGFMASTWTLVRREMLVLSRNLAFVVGRAVVTVVMGLLYASTFYDFEATDVQVVMGVVFQSFSSCRWARQLRFRRSLKRVTSFTVSVEPTSIGRRLLCSLAR